MQSIASAAALNANMHMLAEEDNSLQPAQAASTSGPGGRTILSTSLVSVTRHPTLALHNIQLRATC